jgi:hypothetical protein
MEAAVQTQPAQPQPAPQPQLEPERQPTPDPVEEVATESSLDPALSGDPEEPRGKRIVSSCAARPGALSEAQIYPSLLAGMLLILRTRKRRARGASAPIA